MMNTPMGSNAPMEEIPEGAAVSDVSGEKVGHVSSSSVRDGFFVVEKGWLFTHQLYLPITAILARDANGITLRLSKEELKQDQWKQPPEAAPSEVMAQTTAYPNSPMPAASPAVEEPVALPPNAEAQHPFTPDASGARVMPPEQMAAQHPFTPDASVARVMPPENNGAVVMPPDDSDVRLLPPDEVRPLANEPVDPPPAQE